MLWGQLIKVYTDHKHIMQDALGLISDQVYRQRLILKEYGPEIVHIKRIHHTVADATSRLDFNPDLNVTHECNHLKTFGCTNTQIKHSNWKTFTKRWVNHLSISHTNPIIMSNFSMNIVFANHSEEEEIYPLTVTEIAKAQHEDKTLKVYFTNKSSNDYHLQIYENIEVISKDTKIVIPKLLQKKL